MYELRGEQSPRGSRVFGVVFFGSYLAPLLGELAAVRPTEGSPDWDFCQ